jgi:hypothetical protein
LLAEDNAQHDRWDLRFGLVAATIVNMTPRKNAKQARPDDFFENLKPKESVEDALDSFFGID